MVDSRYDHEGKVYVQVNANFYPDGKLEPLSFIWVNDDGSETEYEIEKITEVRRAASMKAGGVGLRHTIRVMGKMRYLFFEESRWFLEAK